VFDQISSSLIAFGGRAIEDGLSDVVSFTRCLSIFDIVPQNCILKIFSFLSLPEMMTLQRVSKKLKVLADQNQTWKLIFNSRFPFLDDEDLLSETNSKIHKTRGDGRREISYKKAFLLHTIDILVSCY